MVLYVETIGEVEEGFLEKKREKKKIIQELIKECKTFQLVNAIQNGWREAPPRSIKKRLNRTIHSPDTANQLCTTK